MGLPVNRTGRAKQLGCCGLEANQRLWQPKPSPTCATLRYPGLRSVRLQLTLLTLGYCLPPLTWFRMTTLLDKDRSKNTSSLTPAEKLRLVAQPKRIQVDSLIVRVSPTREAWCELTGLSLRVSTPDPLPGNSHIPR